MAEIPLTDLDPRIQKQVQAADQSVGKGNPAYAIEVCSGILDKHPECLDVRKVIRKAQMKLASSKGKGSKVFSGVTNAPFMVKAGKQIKNDPMGAMDTAEKLLKVNPHNIQAHKLLADAAKEAGMQETVIFAYDSIRKSDPRDVENLLALGEAYIVAGKIDDAVKTGDQILAVSPGHGGATEMIRRASVAKSMEQGNWENQGSFKDKLKDEDEALSLEQRARNINDPETINKLINEIWEETQQQPENVNNYRQLADLYRKLGDYDTALQYIAYARSLPTGQADSALEGLEAEYYQESLEKYIEAKQAEVDADPSNETAVQELATTQAQLAEYKMTLAKDRVERYPNDYGYRFEYGELLFGLGDYDQALQQLQLAQRNPNVRTKAILYMGRAFNATNKFDMAVDQLRTLKGELNVMDDVKKSTIYELATSLEGAGRNEEAIEEYKALYQHDIGYRDVADKINAFYAQG